MWKTIPKSPLKKEKKITKSSSKKQNDDTLFVEDEATEYTQWNPFECEIEDWTSEKIELYLCSDLENVPKLLNIIKYNKNPYKGNPYLLCVFEHENKATQLWISSAVIFHTFAYRHIYKEFMQNS